MIDYGFILMTGLLTSMHCVGMCGPIVLTYSVQSDFVSPGKFINNFSLHSAFNIGRILSYTAIGALFGLAGAAISSFRNFTEYFSIICGILMIGAGITLFGILPLPTTFFQGKTGGIFTKIHSIFIKRKTIGSKLSLGLITPLLPCGILYAMFIKAASTGSVIKGGLTMALFGAGMAPALILMGSVSSFFSARFRKHAETIAAITIILMGIILILRGFHVPYLKWFMGGNNMTASGCCH